MTSAPWIERNYAALPAAEEACAELARTIGAPCSVWFVPGGSGNGVVVPARYVVRVGWDMEAFPCTGARQVLAVPSTPPPSAEAQP